MSLEAQVAAALDRAYAEGKARLDARMTRADRTERNLAAARARGRARRRGRRR